MTDKNKGLDESRDFFIIPGEKPILVMNTRNRSALKRMMDLITETRNIRDQIMEKVKQEGDTQELLKQKDRIRIKMDILVNLNYSVNGGLLNIGKLKEQLSEYSYYDETIYDEVFWELMEVLKVDF